MMRLRWMFGEEVMCERELKMACGGFERQRDGFFWKGGGCREREIWIRAFLEAISGLAERFRVL